MIFKKHVHLISLITLSVFICFTFTYEYSFGQNESPLIKAQDLYYKGDFIEAIKVLDGFIIKIKDNQAENKRLAESYYLLARINYDSGEDARTEYFLKLALAAYDQIGQRETNLDFKSRFDEVKTEWFKTKVTKNNIRSESIAETEETTSKIQEKEKPAQQLEKKTKMPWLGLILGALAITLGIAVVVISKYPGPTLKEVNVVFRIKGHFGTYPDTNHLTAASFQIYIDGSYIMDLSYNGYTEINTTFSKILSVGSHQLKFILMSAAHSQVTPSLNIEYSSADQAKIVPPSVNVNPHNTLLSIGDYFNTSFEIVKL